MSELDSAIVIYRVDRIRSSVAVFSMFPLNALEDDDLVADLVFIGDVFSILPFIILEDQALLAFLDLFPICFETHVDKRVSVKD